VEVDCVRPVGTNIGVSIWIDGKLRALVISPRVTDTALPYPPADEERCRLVARHLKRIQRAAADHLQRTTPSATALFVDEQVMVPIRRESSALPLTPVDRGVALTG